MKTAASFGKKRSGLRRSGSGFGRATSRSASDASPTGEIDESSRALEEAVLSSNSESNTQFGGDSAAAPQISFTDIAIAQLSNLVPKDILRMSSRAEIGLCLEENLGTLIQEHEAGLGDDEYQILLTTLITALEEKNGHLGLEAASKSDIDERQNALFGAKASIQPLLMEHIDPSAAAELPRPELAEQVGEVVGELLVQEKINLNLKEQRDLVSILLDDMLGLGPLEPLLADEDISDIMVNGPNQVYIERKGKLVLTDVHFRDNQHLMNIAQRIVSAVGRRIDESSPICDARLADGSRVNAIIPPLAIDGASLSIRKFSEDKITLDKMLEFGSISAPLAKVLKIAGACRLNTLISGGTGSGKTTMLNALSRMIDKTERVVTIEDAAELQLQQPHVVRLETRPPNLEGQGEVTMRDLVKNALRMRPDRIILGEIRGGEAIDMLQAMNTGHDGSMGTVHANRPREALTRMENMVNMAGLNLPQKAIREQISSSVDLIIQVQRMRDGGRRTTYVTEVVGMEGDVVTTQDLFKFEFTGEDEGGNLIGEFKSTGVRPHFLTRAQYFGLDRALMEAMSS